MALYWRLKSVPELSDLPGTVRLRLYRLGLKRAVREHWWGRVLLSSVMQAVVAMLGLWIMIRVCERLYLAGWFGPVGYGGGWFIAGQLAVPFGLMVLFVGGFELAKRPIALALARPYMHEYLMTGV